jgi:integrase
MQSGYIYENGKYWTLRYYEDVLENGRPVRKQKSRKLAPISGQYPNKTSVRSLADEFLAPLNGHQRRPESSQPVVDFLEHTYLPHCRETLRPSTCKGYTQMFGLAKPHLGDITLHEFRTPEADQLMRAALSDKQRAHTTHCNLKSFLSGAFRYAKRTGAVNENPIRDVAIPRGKKLGSTYAYSLDEVHAMLAVLDEPARTLVLVAALTGLGSAELKGLRWEDFTGDELNVSRNVWMGHITETKTLARNAPVPVIDLVKKALEEQRVRTGGVGFIFPARNGKPLRLENLLRRDMRPAFDEAKIKWHGWHAFRRGLATNLSGLGVQDQTIQAILRHSNVSTTRDFYIRPVAAKSVAAMRKMEKAFTKSGARLAKLA